MYIVSDPLYIVKT